MVNHEYHNHCGGVEDAAVMMMMMMMVDDTVFGWSFRSVSESHYDSPLLLVPSSSSSDHPHDDDDHDDLLRPWLYFDTVFGRDVHDSCYSDGMSLYQDVPHHHDHDHFVHSILVIRRKIVIEGFLVVTLLLL